MKKYSIAMMVLVLALVFGGCMDKNTKMLSTAEIGEKVTFGSYEQDNDASNGAEPIEWRVIDKMEDKVFVISEYVLESMPYHNVREKVIWENSSLREWLNNDFMNKAFNEDEQAHILATINKNTAFDDGYQMYDVDNTEDRVFLLSGGEVVDYRAQTPEESESILPEEYRKVLSTEYAKAKGVEVRAEGYCMWWMRSATMDNACFAAAGDDLGKVFNRARPCDTENIGVRPAMWLSIETEK